MPVRKGSNYFQQTKQLKNSLRGATPYFEQLGSADAFESAKAIKQNSHVENRKFPRGHFSFSTWG